MTIWMTICMFASRRAFCDWGPKRLRCGPRRRDTWATRFLAALEFAPGLPRGTTAPSPTIGRATPELARGFCPGPPPRHLAISAIAPLAGRGKLYDAFQTEAVVV